MNDENFFKKAAAHGEEPPLTPQNEHQRSGLRFARRVRLPRAVGLAGMFLPIASTLVLETRRRAGGGWCWSAGRASFSLADSEQGRRSARREIYNLKTMQYFAECGWRNGRKRAAFHRDVDDYVSEFDGGRRPPSVCRGSGVDGGSCRVTLEADTHYSLDKKCAAGMVALRDRHLSSAVWLGRHQTATKLA